MILVASDNPIRCEMMLLDRHPELTTADLMVAVMLS